MEAPDLPYYCINLDDRPEKWAETKVAFEGTGITPKRFSAIRHTEGWRGCGASHVAIVREAMRHGHPWILVVEDDCVPAADFAQRWPVVKKALWEERGAWDIFLGGPTYIKGPIQPHGKHLVEIESGYALHFYVLQAAAYEKVIAWNPDRHGPIDVYYSDQLRIVTSQPILATQRNGVSDIEKKELSHDTTFDDSDRALQQLAYSFRTREGTLVLLALSVAVVAAVWWRR